MRDIFVKNDNIAIVKQTQLITIHYYDFQTKVMQSKGWLSAIERGIVSLGQLYINLIHLT